LSYLIISEILKLEGYLEIKALFRSFLKKIIK